MMAREIQELMKEKMVLEREVQEVQYNIQARGTESHSLQVSNTFNIEEFWPELSDEVPVIIV